MSSNAPRHGPALDESFRRVVVLIAGLVLLLTGLYYVEYGRINQDEGWYLYAARLLYQGQLPYRDFTFFQAPLVPLVYGIPQAIAPGLETGRLTSLAISALTLGLALRLALQRGGAVAVAFVAGGLALAPLAAWTLVSTRTEPLSALCLLVIATSLTPARPQHRHRTLAVLAAVFAVATRISSAPAAIFVAILVLRGHRQRGSLRLKILAPALVVALLLSALIFSGGVDRAWFNLVEVQSERHSQFHNLPPLDASFWLSTRLAYLPELASHFGVAAVISALAAIGFGLLWMGRAELRRGDGLVAKAGPLALLILLAWIPNLVPLVLYPVYLVSVLPLLLVLGGWGVAAIQQRWLGSRPGWRRRGIVAGVVVGLALAQAYTHHGWKAEWATDPPSDLQSLRNVADELQRLVPPDATLFTLDTYLAVAAQRRLSTGLEMGLFSWFPRRPAADGARLGLLTKDRLMAAIADPEVGAIALSDEALGVLVRGRYSGYQPRRRLDQEEIWRAFPPLVDFQLVDVVPRFGPRGAPLYLMVPKSRH